MKYNKILLYTLIAAIAFSCGKQPVYPEYQYGPEDTNEGKVEVFFPQTFFYEELEPDAEAYEIAVSRTDATSALSVPVEVKDAAGVFTVPSTIEFAAGSADATLTIDITKMELETVYDLLISVSSDYYYAYSATSNVSAQRSFHLQALKQKWNDAGTCTFYDDCFYASMQAAENVKIQQHEGTNDYRIVAPYAAIDPEDWAPVNIIFTVEKNEISFATGISDIWPGSGYSFYWDPKGYSSYCYTDDFEKNADGSIGIGVNFLIAVGTTPTYLGWFGWDWKWDECPITIKEGDGE